MNPNLIHLQRRHALQRRRAPPNSAPSSPRRNPPELDPPSRRRSSPASGSGQRGGSSGWGRRGGSSEGGGWRLQGPDSCAAGAGEAYPEAGGEEGVAGDDDEGRIVACRAKGDREVRGRRRKKGGTVRRPRQELAGAGRRRTTAGDRGIRRRCYCLPGIPPLTSPALTSSAAPPRPRLHITGISNSVLLPLHPAARRHDRIRQGSSNTHPLPHATHAILLGKAIAHVLDFGTALLSCFASVLCWRNFNCFVSILLRS